MALAPMKTGIRSSFALLIWIVAAFPILLLAIHAASPTAAAEVANIASKGVEVGVWVLILAVGTALLAYPPFIPGARLWLRDLKTRMSIDQGPTIAARGRLKHLETADDHVLIARTSINMGSPQGALPHLLRAIELEPTHLAAHFHLGTIYRRLGALPKAIEEFLVVIGRDPAYGFGAATLELAICLERTGHDQKALEALHAHNKIAGESRYALLCEARILLALKDADAAKRVLERAAREVEPNQPFTLEEAQARARARFALWRGGRI